MSSLLPILYDQTPQMQLCDLCPQPGDCCAGFNLHTNDGVYVAWLDSWQGDAKNYADSLGLPFVPATTRGQWRCQESGTDYGREYVEVLFACPRLSARGRCEIYADRPAVCRIFQPGSDLLCGFYRDNNPVVPEHS